MTKIKMGTPKKKSKKNLKNIIIGTNSFVLFYVDLFQCMM